MKLARTLEKVTLHPWLITPGGYAAVTRLIESKLARESLAGSNEIPDPEDVAQTLTQDDGIAQIMVSGILGQRLSLLEQICGGCDYLDISQAIDEAIQANVEGILFVFDSPGGMAIGAPELAAKIAAIEVPTVAFTDSLMTSGAYYLASGCDYLVSTPSADVGSIGVILPWVDKERLWSMAGMEFDPIYSEGDTLKTTMYGPSLTGEQRDYLQTRVNQVARDFRNHVSSYRKLDFGQLKAGAYSGQRALDLNLVDMQGSLEDAHNELFRRISKAKT